ncbi:MAG: DUF1028 domain-containing protein [Dehalococcoidia bacterium]
MTYSIVAQDQETGALGVGVQTHQPAVGAIVPWVKFGVGAVATQSFANINFGPQGLALLEAGLEANRALLAIIAGDNLEHRRQVAVIDNAGSAAVHTGSDCIPFASHVIGAGFSTQANMMTSEGVPEAMAQAFTAAKGPLAARIMAALDAGQAAGGDIRGSQSAAILVREPGELSSTWDLRIDNSRTPLEELRTLINIRLAGQMIAHQIADDTMLEVAMAVYREATRLYPSDEQTFWFAVDTLMKLGHEAEAIDMLEILFLRAPQWRDLLLRLTMPGALALKPRFER